MIEGDLRGVVSLWRMEQRPFTEEHIALVETFADQAAIVLQNAAVEEGVLTIPAGKLELKGFGRSIDAHEASGLR